MASIEIYGLSREGQTTRGDQFQFNHTSSLYASIFILVLLLKIVYSKQTVGEKKFRKLIDILNQWYKTRNGFCLNFSFIGA